MALATREDLALDHFRSRTAGCLYMALKDRRLLPSPDDVTSTAMDATKGYGKKTAANGASHRESEIDEASKLPAKRRRSRLDVPPWPAIRLTKARLAAGFSSGPAAAKTYGWTLGTYAGDEGGNRAITPERATLYGAAFRVPELWILEGLLDPNDRSPEAKRAGRLDLLAQSEVAAVFTGLNGSAPAAAGFQHRLREARIAAGFETAVQACDHYRWSRRTYHTHEQGTMRVRAKLVQIYAYAFGADAEWLMLGMHLTRRRKRTKLPLPSVEEVELLNSQLQSSDENRHVASGSSGSGVSRAAQRPANSSHKVEGSKAADQASLSMLSRMRFAIVADAPKGCCFVEGDHVWIDTTDRMGSSSRMLAVDIGDDRVRLIKWGSKGRQDILGCVRGALFPSAEWD